MENNEAAKFLVAKQFWNLATGVTEHVVQCKQTPAE